MPARKRVPRLRAVLSVSLPPETERHISAAAVIRHKSVSAFIRDAAVEEANRVRGIEQAPALAAAS